MSEPSLKRNRIILLLIVVVVSLAALAIVPPRQGRSVIAVARFGSTVRLLPAGLGISFWPLASRHSIPAEDGRAVVEGSFSLSAGDGPELPIRASFHLDGDGRLPFEAVAVRRLGLAEAAGAWLSDVLPPSVDAAGLLANDEQWREIFGGEAGPRRDDVTEEILLRRLTRFWQLWMQMIRKRCGRNSATSYFRLCCTHKLQPRMVSSQWLMF